MLKAMHPETFAESRAELKRREKCETSLYNFVTLNVI